MSFMSKSCIINKSYRSFRLPLVVVPLLIEIYVEFLFVGRVCIKIFYLKLGPKDYQNIEVHNTPLKFRILNLNITNMKTYDLDRFAL